MVETKAAPRIIQITPITYGDTYLALDSEGKVYLMKIYNGDPPYYEVKEVVPR